MPTLKNKEYYHIISYHTVPLHDLDNRELILKYRISTNYTLSCYTLHISFTNYVGVSKFGVWKVYPDISTSCGVSTDMVAISTGYCYCSFRLDPLLHRKVRTDNENDAF
jgi:hypothetical protein